MPETFYQGYSSVVTDEIDTSVFDLELVKQDLLNHFSTRLGERVGRPEFGSIIWELLFDPADPRTESAVVQDAQRIIGEDPRVELLELVPQILIDQQQIELAIRVRAVEFDMESWFNVTFQQNLA